MRWKLIQIRRLDYSRYLKVTFRGVLARLQMTLIFRCKTTRCDKPFDHPLSGGCSGTNAISGDRLLQKNPTRDFLQSDRDVSTEYKSYYIRDTTRDYCRKTWAALSKSDAEAAERSLGIYRNCTNTHSYMEGVPTPSRLPYTRRTFNKPAG
jgi:hypothetical protein